MAQGCKRGKALLGKDGGDQGSKEEDMAKMWDTALDRSTLCPFHVFVTESVCLHEG